MDPGHLTSDTGNGLPRRMLVRGVNWLGDAIMSTPALQRLRERFPQAHVALATPEKLADLWQGHPAIDQVIPIAAGSNPWAVARAIRRAEPARAPDAGSANHFELGLVLPNSPRSALEMWLAGIPRRVGYARPWRNWLLTQKVVDRPAHLRMVRLTEDQVRQLVRQPPAIPHPFLFKDADSHQIHEYLHLVSAVGADSRPTAPKLTVSAKELADARARLAGFGFAGSGPRVWLGLNASAAYGPAKRWPTERFAAAARATLRQLPGAVWILFGTRDDQPLCDQIAHHAGSQTINLAGQTSLRQLMATLKHCAALLTNDSGPMHLAAALGTPVVALFGSTSPALTGPGLPGDRRHRLLSARVPCAPCFRRACPIDLRCMTGITVDTVVSALLAAAAESRDAARV